MRNRLIKVGAAVPSMKVGDVSYNTGEIISLMNAAKDCGLVVFPELCISGYTCADLFDQEALIAASEEGLRQIATASEKRKGTTYVVGIPVKYGNCLYNCAAIVSEGVIAGIVPKTNIPAYSEFYELRWFASGKDVIGITLTIAGQEVPFGIDLLAEDRASAAVLGIDICEDLWVPDRPSTHACLAGANLIANLSASDEVIGKADYRRNLVLHQSADCYCGYIYTSAATDESSTDLVFSGHSMIASNGKMLAEIIYPERPALKTAVIDLDALEYNRTHQNTFANESDDWYRRAQVHIKPLGGAYETTVDTLVKRLKKEQYTVSRMPFVPSDDRELAERCSRILQIQANGLATRVRATNIKTLVIGVSGGLDSTLALLVCNEARKLVKDIRIIAYTMPSKGNTSDRTYKNAVDLMKCLKAEIREVEIGKPVKEHLITLGHGGEYKGEGDTTYENAQARMRTYILMDAANMENGLVVGTGDLSELALGWCTYNGDHMSMYGVNGSVPKTLVQYICRAYALTCGDEKLKDVLLDIVGTPISPELTPNKKGVIAQKTEDKIGKYDLNDFFLYYVMRWGFAPDKILALAMLAYDDLDKEFIRNAEIRFYNRFFHQQFKRSCLPDGPKVGTVTLSPRGDWRMPSDASVNLWLEILKNA